MRILLDIKESKLDYAIEFFKNISFIKKATVISDNEITNPKIIKAIEDYENKKSKTVAVSLKDLEKLINA